MGACLPSYAEELIGGYSPELATSLGERMFREGILPDGGMIHATISGDISVHGDMFACINCHQRSGLGTVEGSMIVWPVNGKELYSPRRRTGAWRAEVGNSGPGAKERWMLPEKFQTANVRPAYTDETLARMIRTGVDSSGKSIGKTMPQFTLSNNDMSVLVHYLKNLSAENAFSPGVDQNTLRFATVITEDVPKQDREAMLKVLQAHINARNTQTRPHLRRAERGPFYKTEAYGAYRKLELDVWELKGEPETWRSQLEAHYSASPIFALLGGISSGSWNPIHLFCEDHGIPSILPVTDRPVISETDWYTLYFSKGSYQQGETVARYLSTFAVQQAKTDIIQFYQEDFDGQQIANGFQETWRKAGKPDIQTIVLRQDQHLPKDYWIEIAKKKPTATILLWMNSDEIRLALSQFTKLNNWKGQLFMPANMGQALHIPENIRDRVYLTYSYSLPGENEIKRQVLQRWLTLRGIPKSNIEIQSKMYFLGWMLPAALKHMRGEFYRDYFMEGFDMMGDQHYSIAIYPRLSFASGQRYLAKGSYIFQMSKDENPELVKAVNWTVDY